MTALLGQVFIAGQAASCLDVNAVITHGRRTATDAPTASSATVTLYRLESEGMPAWAAGDELVVLLTDGRRRFTGTITDADITGHINTDRGRAAVWALQASGAVATLGARDVGQPKWPEEPARDRAGRILAASGVPYQVQANPNMRVIAQDVDRRTALDLITNLAQDVGAAVFDTPDGRVVFQHYSARAQTWAYRQWLDAPGVWNEQAAWYTDWNSTARVAANAPVPLALDMCAIGWEPVWRSTSGAVVNDVTLAYGPMPTAGAARPTMTASRPASVARYGRRHYGAEPQLADEASARERAGMILDLHADPRWAIDQVVMYLSNLNPADHDNALALMCGSRVMLTRMPQPAPQPTPVRVVEGWTHTLSKTRSDLTLHLSDPLHSYAGIIWGALAPAGRWQDVPPATLWVDALTDPAHQGAP